MVHRTIHPGSTLYACPTTLVLEFRWNRSVGEAIPVNVINGNERQPALSTVAVASRPVTKMAAVLIAVYPMA